jgi:hypothetical protein
MQATLHASLLGMSILRWPITPSLSWKPAGNEDPIFRILAAAEGPAPRPDLRAWTDDYNNLFQILK